MHYLRVLTVAAAIAALSVLLSQKAEAAQYRSGEPVRNVARAAVNAAALPVKAVGRTAAFFRANKPVRRLVAAPVRFIANRPGPLRRAIFAPQRGPILRRCCQ